MTQSPLADLLAHALQSSDATALEHFLIEHSHLPGPRGNLELLADFAEAAREILSLRNPPLESLATLVDCWAADDADVTQPRVMLPCAAVLAFGEIGAVRPDQWEKQIVQIRTSAADPRWRVREMVAAALQRLLATNWERATSALLAWVTEDDPLVVRAAAAGVAEPSLLKRPDHALDALEVQRRSLETMARFPAALRHSENVRTLRQALGYTLSVAVAAVPDEGFALLERTAAAPDADLRWIVRENLKKKRLNHWPDRVATVSAQLQ